MVWQREKRQNVFDWLRRKNHSIYFIQETHSILRDEAKRMEEWEGKIIFSHGLKNSRGVMIMFKKNLKYTLQSTETDQQGRWVILNLIIEDKAYCLINLYGPNTDEPTFFQSIYNNIEKTQLTNLQLIMAGDFNFVQNVYMDRKGNSTNRNHPNAQTEVAAIMNNLDLIDIWRIKNPKLKRYTWRRKNLASGIDYFLIPFSMISKIKKVEIEEKLRSDHYPIILHIEITEYPRGKGFWKFNQKLLEDHLFMEKTKEFITDFFNWNIKSADPLVVWDTFKCVFRGHSIQLAAQRSKQISLK